MGRDPVAVALSNSPELTTLAGALSGRLNTEVDLTETLNKGQYTVFAPTDDAFGKLAPEMLDKLRNDAGLLSSVLKYHVVSGGLDPKAVVGDQPTLQGQPVKVSGAGDDVRVNDAGVVCGRTSQNVMVNFPGELALVGQAVTVRAERGFTHSLRGAVTAG